MKKVPQQQPIMPEGMKQFPQRSLGSGPTKWTCRYRAERKLWIFQKVGKASSMQGPEGEQFKA